MPSDYREVYEYSVARPGEFWAQAAAGIDWHRTWDKVLASDNAPFYRWFEGGKLNTCYNAVDRHVERGHGDRKAIIYVSPVTGSTLSLSYSELQDRVARFAGALVQQGVKTGDRVIIYMPMIPEAVVAMLACARIGAVHCVVFGGFAARELAVRIDDAKPVCIVSASCGIEVDKVIEYKPLLDQAIDLARHKPKSCIVLQRDMCTASLVAERDVDWREALLQTTSAPCVPVAATDPLYILYTSGTTGQPKGIVRDNGGHAVALSWSMKNIYGVSTGEVFWAASDIGWVVGHSYIVYGPLLNGNSTVIYEGKPVGTPDPGAFWQLISDHGVGVLFTAPTALRAIKKEDPTLNYLEGKRLSSLSAVFLAGERTDPDTVEWARQGLGVPIIDHWWQTETGWAICANCLGIEKLPVKPGSTGLPAPGMQVSVLNENGLNQNPGELGALAIKLPLPPGSLSTLWEADERCHNTYFNDYPGYYHTADAGLIDEDGYVYVMARTDDVINVAGHRLSTGAIEESIAANQLVAECAVFGVADPLKGQLPLGLIVLKSDVRKNTEEAANSVISGVRKDIGPVAAFKLVAVVDRLPKTKSGKILRGTMRKIADGEDWKMPATVDDPEVFNGISAALRQLGYPRFKRA